MEIWFYELLKGLGQLFLHPFLYGAIIAALLLGLKRVKRERKDFHVRVYDSVLELGQLFLPSIIIGLILSIITIGLGVTVPIGFVTVAAGISLLFVLTLQVRWTSPAFVVSFSLFIVFFMTEMGREWGGMLELSYFSFSHVSLLLAILVLGEAIILMRVGGGRTSPLLLEGKRGKRIGAHESRKLWLLPLFLLIPVESGVLPISWWPVLPGVNDQSYLFMFVPFASGISQRVRTELPEVAMKRSGRHVFLLALLLGALAVLSFWFSYVAVATWAVAIIGREWIYYLHKRREEQTPNIFTERSDGLVILGIIPKSSAEKFNLKVGERIKRVNKVEVHSEKEFYEALQRNSAFCKMEVVDSNGELRFAQGAIYEGEHHELGLLFLPVENTKITVIEDM